MNVPASPQALFSAAEQAFVQGRPEEAQASLIKLERMGVVHPAIHHLRALVERRLGNFPQAARAFEAAIRLAPTDPQIANNHGNLLGDMGDHKASLAAYDRALKLDPSLEDAAFNRAITLHKLKRFAEARAAFHMLSEAQPESVRVWNALAAMEREAGDLAAAAAAYDRALAQAPDNLLASRGRARIAMERGEDDTLARYAAARTLAPENDALLLEETELRADAGDKAALALFATRMQAAPQWTEGQLALARMRWEAGEANFTANIEALLASAPQRRDLWYGLIRLLSEAGYNAEAAEAALQARAALGEPEFALAEAMSASRAGDLEPLTAIEPKEGRLALFPSYLHHGTRPFPAGERMTVAIDIALSAAQNAA